MADDDAFYSPNHGSTIQLRQPKSGQHVWSLHKNGRRVDCELRFHGESYGWECIDSVFRSILFQRRDLRQNCQRHF